MYKPKFLCQWWRFDIFKLKQKPNANTKQYKFDQAYHHSQPGSQFSPPLLGAQPPNVAQTGPSTIPLALPVGGITNGIEQQTVSIVSIIAWLNFCYTGSLHVSSFPIRGFVSELNVCIHAVRADFFFVSLPPLFLEI